MMIPSSRSASSRAKCFLMQIALSLGCGCNFVGRLIFHALLEEIIVKLLEHSHMLDQVGGTIYYAVIALGLFARK